jgi:hypothetical protein
MLGGEEMTHVMRGNLREVPELALDEGENVRGSVGRLVAR